MAKRTPVTSVSAYYVSNYSSSPRTYITIHRDRGNARKSRSYSNPSVHSIQRLAHAIHGTNFRVRPFLSKGLGYVATRPTPAT